MRKTGGKDGLGGAEDRRRGVALGDQCPQGGDGGGGGRWTSKGNGEHGGVASEGTMDARVMRRAAWRAAVVAASHRAKSADCGARRRGGSDGGAQQADHHALDGEVDGGQQIGIAGIFGAQAGASLVTDVALEGGFAIDQGGDDVAGPRFAWREEDDVAVENGGAGHGVSADAQGVDGSALAQAEGRHIEREEAIRLTLVGGGQPGGDDAVQWHVGQGGAARRWSRRQQPAGVAGQASQQTLVGEHLQVALDPVRTGKFAVGLDFADRRGDALPLPVGEDEVENLTLARGKGAGHSVQMNTRRASRNPSLA